MKTNYNWIMPGLIAVLILFSFNYDSPKPIDWIWAAIGFVGGIAFVQGFLHWRKN
jgi:hypothetical protein